MKIAELISYIARESALKSMSAGKNQNIKPDAITENTDNIERYPQD